MTAKAPKIVGLSSPAPQCGKSTIANILASYGYTTLPFASTLKRMLHALLMDIGYEHSEATQWMTTRKEDIIPELNASFRRLATTLGTEWARDNLDVDFWIKVWMCRYNQLWVSQGDHLRVVVDDVRFPNEVDILRRMDPSTQLWQVVRQGMPEPATQHRSEGGLINMQPDVTVWNIGTLEELHNQVRVNLKMPPLPTFALTATSP